MTSRQAAQICFCALLAVPVGVFFGFGLWFAPGWANGWPGLPQREVWPAGLATVAFVTVLCAAVGPGIAVCSRLGGDRGQAARWPFRTWVICAVVLGLVVWWWVYEGCHATAVELWP
jgi:hypothetical protein